VLLPFPGFGCGFVFGLANVVLVIPLAQSGFPLLSRTLNYYTKRYKLMNVSKIVVEL